MAPQITCHSILKHHFFSPCLGCNACRRTRGTTPPACFLAHGLQDDMAHVSSLLAWRTTWQMLEESHSSAQVQPGFSISQAKLARPKGVPAEVRCHPEQGSQECSTELGGAGTCLMGQENSSMGGTPRRGWARRGGEDDGAGQRSAAWRRSERAADELWFFPSDKDEDG